jgi:hypothetical protein
MANSRPNWCPHQECGYKGSSQDCMCVGELPTPTDHGEFKAVNTHRLCMTHSRPGDAPWHFEFDWNRTDAWVFAKLINRVFGLNLGSAGTRIVPASASLAAPSQPADQCEDCKGTGQICTGTSGQAEDGNAPVMERCPSCGYGESQPAEPEDEIDHGKSMLRVQEALGFTTTGWVSPDVVLMRIWQLQNKPSHPAAEQAAAEGEREAFEAWAREKGFDLSAVQRDGEWVYADSSTELAEFAWKAARRPVRELTDADSAELERLRALVNTPELHDFANGVVLEAAHQRERWGIDHDSGKEPSDWFWLVGYLGGKALKSHIDGNTEKALHHTITMAAACANWHAAISGASTAMRPGIAPPVEATGEGK